MDGLEQMQPFIEAVTERAENVLKGTISALLNLIEDASNFILTYLSDKLVGTSDELRFVPYLTRFGTYSPDISRSCHRRSARTNQRAATEIQGPQCQLRSRRWGPDDESSVHNW